MISFRELFRSFVLKINASPKKTKDWIVSFFAQMERKTKNFFHKFVQLSNIDKSCFLLFLFSRSSSFSPSFGPFFSISVVYSKKKTSNVKKIDDKDKKRDETQTTKKTIIANKCVRSYEFFRLSLLKRVITLVIIWTKYDILVFDIDIVIVLFLYSPVSLSFVRITDEFSLVFLSL